MYCVPFQQGRLVADQVEGVVVKNTGHGLMEEAPEQVIPILVAFLNRCASPVSGWWPLCCTAMLSVLSHTPWYYVPAD